MLLDEPVQSVSGRAYLPTSKKQFMDVFCQPKPLSSQSSLSLSPLSLTHMVDTISTCALSILYTKHISNLYPTHTKTHTETHKYTHLCIWTHKDNTHTHTHT